MYPADTKDPKKPHGKLRLCYECAPMAFIAEQAGGYASDGVNPIRSIQPHDLHQRLPFFVGNRELVEKVEEYVKKYDAGWVEEYRQHLKLREAEAMETMTA